MIAPLVLFFAAMGPSLPWIDDNYAKAIDQAKSRHVPLFVEVWAPW